MKIRMLDSVYGRFHNDENGVQRGDIVDIDEFHAKRYIVNGLATGNLKGALPQPYRETPESEALRVEVMQRVAAQTPEDARPLPERVIGGRRKAWQGWLK